MNKIFDKEVDSWNSLYQKEGKTGSGRYAIFQKKAQERINKRLYHCLRLLNPQSGMSILDLACGSGVFRQGIISKGAKWVGIDISFNILNYGKKLDYKEINEQTDWVNGSADALPFRDSVFDAVICIGMINFYSNETLLIFLANISRVLRPRGTFILTSLRLDILTWLRSRLYPRFPLPISTPGPLYPMHYQKVLSIIAESPFECVEMISVKKYLGLPHYTIFKLLKE